MDWVKVTDKLPDLNREVLVYYRGSRDIGFCGWQGYGIGFVAKGGNCYEWFTNQGFATPKMPIPTHWAPLLTPPIKK